MSEKLKGLIALLLTVAFWTFSVVFARAVVHEIKPFTLLFIRLLIAAVAFLPFFLKRKIWKHPKFKNLVLVSLTFMLNMTFYILAIQYTSASASQVIYAATPILIMVIGALFMKEKYALGRIAGVVIGLIGVLLIFYLSVQDNGLTITGTLWGNFLMGIGVIGWISYILSTKKILKTFSAIDTTSVAMIISFLISIPLFIFEISTVHQSFNFSTNGLLGAVYIGFFGTFLTYLLHQYALSRLSALTTSFTSYISPVSTAILEIILLKEKLTTGFLFGGGLVLFGVFLATTLEFLQKRK